jgi:hypothetical protein
VASDAHIPARQRRVYLRLVVDLDIAGGMNLALYRPAETHIAVDVELADQTIARSEGDGAALA